MVRKKQDLFINSNFKVNCNNICVHLKRLTINGDKFLHLWDDNGSLSFLNLLIFSADTSAILRAQETLWPGPYEVEVLVKDEQGKACPEPQKIKVHVCTCGDGVICGEQGANGQPTKSSEFGPAGIGLLFLGLLLLLRKFTKLLALVSRCKV